jgi:hypothetical protein
VSTFLPVPTAIYIQTLKVQIRVTIERAGEEAALASLRASAAKNDSPQSAIAAAAVLLDLADAQSNAASSELWIELRVWAEAGDQGFGAISRLYARHDWKSMRTAIAARDFAPANTPLLAPKVAAV